MKTLIIKSAIVVCTMLTGSNAYSNLIINGDFEEQSVTTGGWKWFKAEDILGWQGSNIEIWNNLNGFAAAQGSQHIELNAHGPNEGAFSIYQNFNTEPGEIYKLNFFYSARNSVSEQFKVDIIASNTQILESFYIADHLVRIWQDFETSFQASTQVTKLQFTSILPSTGTLGNLLDNINVQRQVAITQVTQSTEIPEPHNLLLVTLGFFGLSLMRKTY